MKWPSSIRRYLMWRVIDIALRKNAPSSIPTSGEAGRQTDCFVVTLLDSEERAWFLANEMHPQGLSGKWSVDGKEFIAQCSVPYAALGKYTLFIQHHYKGWGFYSHGLLSFHWKFLTGYPFWRVLIDRCIQALFNRRKLTRRDRMKVLSHILSETLKDREYQAHTTTLLTHFYSVRWVHRPDQAELQTYYSLLLASLKASNDVSETAHHGFKLEPQALNTIADYQQEERRHSDNYKVQRGIYLLTIMLLIAAVAQAISAGVEAWDTIWKQ